MDATLNPAAPEATAPAASDAQASAPDASAPATAPTDAASAPAPTDSAPAAAPASAPAPAPTDAAPTPDAPPALTPEQDAVNKQREAQAAVQAVIKSKEDQCAAEISKVCDRFGCELIVGHSVKVRFRNQAQQ
jgi:hypothetical protein